MPSKVVKRGKGPRDQSQHVEPPESPSELLASVLKTLSMTFERDIGMLNGKHVRTVPDKLTLVELKRQLDKLLLSLKDIAESDREVIQTIERIRDAREVKEAQKVQEESAASPAVCDDGTGKPTADAVESELVQGTAEAVSATGKPDQGTGSHVGVGVSSDEGSESTVVPKRRKRSLNLDNDDEEVDELKQERPTDSFPIGPSKKIKLDEENSPDVGVGRRENDPMVKNPKSEFVVSQTLPVAAAALGLFNESGLESTGEENLKRKYDVASYPTNDLKELLPGELPDMDFSHPKPTNQIQYGTFLSSVESFFRALSDDDIKFLKCKYIMPANLEMDKSYDPEVTPFIIPRLGPLYSEMWQKDQSSQDLTIASPPPVSDLTSVLPRKSAADINDSALEAEDISCGPLVSRLLSAILKDENENGPNSIDAKVRIKEETANDVPTSQNDSLTSQADTPAAAAAQTPMSETDDTAKPLTGGTTSSLPEPHRWTFNSINLDYPTFEERLKRELKYVGIYVNMPKDESNPTGDDPDWLTGREDDEISAELRELQNSLKQVTAKNQKRKIALIPLVERRLAWQEYSSILDDLDKQIDQAYVKRIRVPKKRKKNHPTSSSVSNTESASQVAQQKAANSSLKALLDKRQRWITKIGPLFDRSETMKRIPKESVFKDMDQEEEEEETDPFAQNGNGKEDELAEA